MTRTPLLLRHRLCKIEDGLANEQGTVKGLIGVEACGGAHYRARELSKLGHTVKLMVAQFVILYRKRAKNDVNNAEAICEAAIRTSWP